MGALPGTTKLDSEKTYRREMLASVLTFFATGLNLILAKVQHRYNEARYRRDGLMFKLDENMYSTCIFLNVILLFQQVFLEQRSYLMKHIVRPKLSKLLGVDWNLPIQSIFGIFYTLYYMWYDAIMI